MMFGIWGILIVGAVLFVRWITIQQTDGRGPSTTDDDSRHAKYTALAIGLAALAFARSEMGTQTSPAPLSAAADLISIFPF